MLCSQRLLLFLASLYMSTSAISSASSTPPSPLITAPPRKRAIADNLVGSRQSDGKWTTSKCQAGSTFMSSSTFAGCIAPGEQLATACAPNHRSKESTIVNQSLWCTYWCFTSNTIYTTAAANPLVMMNCFGDYKLSRYPDTVTTTTKGPRASSITSGSSVATNTGSVDTPVAPKEQDSKKLTRGEIAAVVIGTVAGVVTIISLVIALKSYWWNRRTNWKKVSTIGDGF
jgi:hypothetical protein